MGNVGVTLQRVLLFPEIIVLLMVVVSRIAIVILLASFYRIGYVFGICPSTTDFFLNFLKNEIFPIFPLSSKSVHNFVNIIETCMHINVPMGSATHK